MTTDELGELVRLLQAVTPLERLSNMEARTVFEFMEQRGYKIGCPGGRADPAASERHSGPLKEIKGNQNKSKCRSGLANRCVKQSPLGAARGDSPTASPSNDT